MHELRLGSVCNSSKAGEMRVDAGIEGFVLLVYEKEAWACWREGRVKRQQGSGHVGNIFKVMVTCRTLEKSRSSVLKMGVTDECVSVAVEDTELTCGDQGHT